MSVMIQPPAFEHDGSPYCGKCEYLVNYIFKCMAFMQYLTYDKDVKQFERCEACIAASGQDGSEWE